MTRRVSIPFAAGLLALALTSALSAAAAAQPAGEYRGSFDDTGGRPVPVLLHIDAGRAIGDAAGSIRFQEPWACGFDLQVAGVQGEVATYSFTRAGAGRCTPYTQGYARIQPDGLGIDVQLLKKDNSAGPRIFLSPVTRGN
ncbi:hypothetical protein [Ferrovibrio xuzhouensis]|uniref:Secreted protein n=1 Tax=Ferrovibrio xuzhouensis TaxID=1576914 RepID=A0ABV7VEI5_9PROT